MTPTAIISDVALTHLVPVRQITGLDRCKAPNRRTTRAKKEAITRLDKETDLSCLDIAKLMNLHHTTVLHHLERLSRKR